METAKGYTRFTESMEDHLRLLYELSRDGGEVSGSRLVECLGVRHASVTNMLKKLEGLGLVWREPYYGMGLTDAGQRAALGVIRRHRLIELYLVEALGYSWEEVHEEAESLEHAASEEFADRLERLLGYPEADAHGSPIPTRDGRLPEQPSYLSMAGLCVGQEVVVRRVLDRDPQALKHLAGMGLTLGTEVEVLERHPFDGPLVLDSGGKSLLISPNLACHVFVEHLGSTDVERNGHEQDGREEGRSS